MRLRCLNCEEVFDEDELVTIKGDRYEHFGFTGCTSSKGCPVCCNDEIEEVRKED
jgi:hypothetical protein